MSYYSMWVMKPFPGKTKDAQKAISAMCKHWKRHGAEETIGSNLYGSAYGHISLVVKFKNMESYGKANDKLVKDSKVHNVNQTTGEILLRHPNVTEPDAGTPAITGTISSQPITFYRNNKK